MATVDSAAEFREDRSAVLAACFTISEAGKHAFDTDEVVKTTGLPLGRVASALVYLRNDGSLGDDVAQGFYVLTAAGVDVYEATLGSRERQPSTPDNGAPSPPANPDGQAMLEQLANAGKGYLLALKAASKISQTLASSARHQMAGVDAARFEVEFQRAIYDAARLQCEITLKDNEYRQEQTAALLQQQLMQAHVNAVTEANKIQRENGKDQSDVLEKQASFLLAQSDALTSANAIQRENAKSQAEVLQKQEEFLRAQTQVLQEQALKVDRTNRLYSQIRWLTVILAIGAIAQAVATAWQASAQSRASEQPASGTQVVRPPSASSGDAPMEPSFATISISSSDPPAVRPAASAR